MVAEKHIPKVSVIVPVYNGENLLSQAIESVLSQTFQDFEILIIDDGPSDQSPNIIKQYEEQYPEKVKYLEHPNHKNCGISASRNLGIQNAAGEYVAFLDSDALWLPEKLEHQVKILDNHQDVGLVSCVLALIDEQGNPTKKMSGGCVVAGNIPEGKHQIFDLFFSRSISIGLGSTSLIRKPILFEVGLFGTNLVYQYEDSLVAGKIAYLYPVFLSPHPLVNYRSHTTNASWEFMAGGRGKKVAYQVMLRIYEWVKAISKDSHTPAFWLRLANLSSQAYQNKIISRWGLYKLLFKMFPYTSTDLQTSKAFISLFLGQRIALTIQKALRTLPIMHCKNKANHLLRDQLSCVDNNATLPQIAQDIGKDWKQHSYYDEAEQAIDHQWNELVWPFIKGYDFSCVIDLAAGHGRNSKKLKDIAQKIYIVDINGENIEFCRKRFASDERFHFIQNDGFALNGIRDEEITFIYCFDAMVHFDSDIIRAYLCEFRRVLKPGGYGFCHHSNYTKNPGGNFRNTTHWRNFMSKQLFAHYCAKEGLEVVKSKIIDWGEPELDCLTLFKKPS